MTDMSVAVIGNCYFDEIYLIQSFPDPDDKLIASDVKTTLGGGGSNTATALAKLGINVKLLTVVGTDHTADELLLELKTKGVATNYVQQIEGKTGRTIILLDDQKRSTKIGYHGVCSDLSKVLELKNIHEDFSHIHLVSTRIATVAQTIQMKGSRSISLDFGAKTLLSSKKEIFGILDQLDLVFMNQSVFHELFQKRIQEVVQGDISFSNDLIVTAGNMGIYGFFNNTLIHQPAFPTQVVDTTGAGDAAAAAIIFSRLQNQLPEQLLRNGAVAASIQIQTYGGSDGHATVEEIKKFLGT
jgi:sugar/nucleoside kinase (ribokinase family)